MRQPFPAPASVRFLTDSLGLYIHIPFCKRKCAYCDFYSGVPFGRGLEDYISALIKETEKWGGEIKSRPIDTIYIGGGTPSVLGNKICDILRAVKKSFSVTEDAEITAEVNPESAEVFLPAARRAGVNRISVGVQSGNDAMLKRLGRLHTAKKAEETVALARRLGFDNISADLMIALPESDENTLKGDLEFIAGLETEHISAYILKAEPGTPLFESGTRLPDEDQAAEQYLKTCEYFENAGFCHYEISNFAKPGFYSRHNLKYWRDEEYLGIGPSAHSFIGGKRFYYPRDIKAFNEAPRTVFDGEGGTRAEKLMLGLRLKEGVDLGLYGKITPDTEKKLDMLCCAGYIIKNGSKVSLTDKGMLVSNSIITELTE